MEIECPYCKKVSINLMECDRCHANLEPLVKVLSLPGHFIDEGTACLAVGRMDEAVEKFSAAISLMPDSTDALCNLALVLSGQGLHDSALTHLDKALELAPNDPNIEKMRNTVVDKLKQEKITAEQQALRQSRRQKFLWVLPVVALLFGISGGSVLGPRYTNDIPQSAMVEVVRARLGEAYELKELTLNVSPLGKGIQISGEVPSSLHRQLILALASQGKGPPVDISNIQITPKPNHNWVEIVRHRLDANPIFNGLGLQVVGDEGTVRLSGEMPSETHRAMAIALASLDIAAKLDTSAIKVKTQESRSVVLATYPVKKGDSWWLIAHRLYGNGSYWQELAQANQRKTLKFGDRLVLPALPISP